MLTRDELRVGETYVSVFGDAEEDKKRTIIFVGEKIVVYKNNKNSEFCLDIASALRNWNKLPVRHKRWVNFYAYTSNSHSTKELADAAATKARIACIEIEFEEGQGL